MSGNTELVTTTAGTGTAAEWTAKNPVLELGEWGKETDTGKMKNGDGVTAWNSLSYSVVPDIDLTIDSKASKTGPQVCKALVNFNGVGTISIRNSFNVSSITDIGVGRYEINFTTNMEGINYLVIGSCGTGAFESRIINTVAATPTTSKATIYTTSHAGSAVDVEYIQIAVYE